MAKNHKKLRELLDSIQEEFIISKVDFKQRLSNTEEYFDENHNELKEMQEILNNLL